MDSSNFKVGDKVIYATGLKGEVVAINNSVKDYTHHIVWEDGREDWYADKPFRKGEIKKQNNIKTDVVGGVEVERRRVVIAAIKKNGVVFTGLRHGHIIVDMVKCGFLVDKDKDYVKQSEQGFVDSLGNYEPRAVARITAINAGQIDEKHGTLYSEDLW